MHQAGTERPGTMAAVLGLATAQVEAACREASHDGAVATPANLNAPDQTVISGDPDAVRRAGEACKARGAKRVIPLKVSGAFHSPLMAPAATHLRIALDPAPFRDPRFPALANATAGPVQAAAAGLGGDHSARGYACDVSRADQVESTVGVVERELGPIAILVNNAGTTRDNLVLRISDDDWNAVLDTNLKGAFLMTKHVARGMIKRRHGRIVNVTSVVGLWGNAGQANYAASKAGLVGFTKSVAKELASRNVLVNAIAPGFVETELTNGLTAEARQGFIDAIPLRRLGEAADVASAVLFLASDFASYITGQVLVVDGGLVL